MISLFCSCCDMKLSQAVSHNISFIGNDAILKPEGRDSRLCVSQTSVSTYESTRRHSPEEQHCRIDHSDNLSFLLGCTAVFLIECRPTFQRYLLPPSSTNLWDFKFSRRRVWSSESSGMYCCVLNWMSTDVSEVLTASHHQQISEISSSHGGEYETQNLLGCTACS
jgi:hypothetical protein